MGAAGQSQAAAEPAPAIADSASIAPSGSAGATAPIAPDSTAPVVETPARAGGDSVRASRAGTFDQPRWVMMRSLLVPGWGQWHNRAWIKAGLVAGSEAALFVNVRRDGRLLRVLDAEVATARRSGDLVAENSAVERYNARLNRFVGRQWLLGGLVVYALVDAYVDAHFVNFKFEFDHDPALPAGVRMGLEKGF